jgi:cell division protein FtsW
MNASVAESGSLNISLVAVTAILVSVGLIMVFSSSTILAMNAFGDPYFFVKRQLAWAGLGLTALWFLSRYPYGQLRKLVAPGLILSVCLMVAVLVLSIGKTVGGARRWFILGPVSFQPAELMKVMLVLYFADALARKQKRMASFKEGVLPFLLILGAVASLLLLQPDLGTAIILMSVGLAMIYVAGARFNHLLSLGLAALPAVFLLIYKVAYRRRRWDAFLDPWHDPLGRGFQMIQSFLALGSGGLWGRGLCESQQKLFYLPAPHTDFIFSILGEELGFAGTFILMLLFGFLVWEGFTVARRCAEPFGKLLAIGLTLLLGFQALVNMGVATGLVPTKGTTLPFISAGGSSLFFSLAAIGILLSVSRFAPLAEEP